MSHDDLILLLEIVTRTLRHEEILSDVELRALKRMERQLELEIVLDRYFGDAA